jgi:hypothetical protein
MPRFRSLSLLQDLTRQASVGDVVPPGMSAYLAQELRDSHPYLRDKGWHNVARLMLAAADEIDRLDDRVRTLESRTAIAPERTRR